MHEARHSDGANFYHSTEELVTGRFAHDRAPNGPYTLEAAIFLHLAHGIRLKNPKAAVEILVQAILKLHASPAGELTKDIYAEILALRSAIKSELTADQLALIDPAFFEFALP